MLNAYANAGQLLRTDVGGVILNSDGAIFSSSSVGCWLELEGLNYQILLLYL